MSSKGAPKTEIKIQLTLTYLDPAPRKYASQGAKELGRQMHAALMGVLPTKHYENVKVEVTADDLVPHEVTSTTEQVAGEPREVLRCATCNTFAKDHAYLTRRQWREKRAAFFIDHPVNEDVPPDTLGARP